MPERTPKEINGSWDSPSVFGTPSDNYPYAYKDATLYVPKTSIEDYKYAQIWRFFKNIKSEENQLLNQFQLIGIATILLRFSILKE